MHRFLCIGFERGVFVLHCTRVAWGVVTMSLLIVVLVGAVYGGSVLVMVGGTIAWKMSYRFRSLLVGDHATR